MNYKDNMLIRKVILLSIVLWLMPLTGFTQTDENTSGKAGTIVFSNQPITNESFSPDIMKDQFDATDRIYGRIFLEKPLGEVYDDYGWEYDFYGEMNDYNRSIDIYMDGKKMIQWLDELPRTGFHNYTYLDLVILPEQDARFDHSMSVSDWLKAVGRLQPGEHTVTVKLRATAPEHLGLGKDALSTGSFTMSVTEQGKKELTNNYLITMPDATMKSEDSNIEEQVVSASEDMYPGLVPVRAVIVEPTADWRYTRDRQGNILNRFFTAAVGYEGFGDECYVRTAIYMQKHRGYGQYDDVRLSRKLNNMYDYKLPCANLFK